MPKLAEVMIVLSVVTSFWSPLASNSASVTSSTLPVGSRLMVWVVGAMNRRVPVRLWRPGKGVPGCGSG